MLELMTATRKAQGAASSPHGPYQLLHHYIHGDGSWEAGYYGLVESSEFISGADLMSAFELTGTSVVENPVWMKFLSDGKVIFIPTQAIFRSCAWTVMYEKGLVYGTDDPGYSKTLPPIPQNAGIVIDGHRYLVRLPKGNAPGTDTTVLNLKDSEWGRLIYPVDSKVALSNTEYPVKWDSLSLGMPGYHTLLANLVAAANQAYCVGYSGAMASSVVAWTSPNQYVGWRPVLEYLGKA